MMMTRDREPVPPLHPALLHPNEIGRLQAVFRRALQVAFASSLMAAGCTSTHGNSPGGQVPAGSGGSSGGVSTPSAGRTAGNPAGNAASAGRPSPLPPVAGTGATSAGTGGMPSGTPADAGPPSSGDAGSSEPIGDDAGTSPTGEGVPPVCDPSWRMLTELNPAEPFDFAAFRMVNRGAPIVNELAREGTPCATATQVEACETELREGAFELTSFSSCGQLGDCIRYIVTTRGDAVRHFANLDEVKAFLGPVDRPQEALLLLHYMGYEIRCEMTRVWSVTDGFEATVQSMVNACPVQHANVRAHVRRDGTVTELSRELLPPTNACIGRRPEGLTEAAAADGCSELGAHFASIAQLEAASVAAFDVLARELEAHRAPSSLIAAAREAARDEVRHAARTSQLARRFGAIPQAARVEPRPLRGLEALALDNAIEGCVRETFGAAVGCYQARAARDPEIAAAMTEIAADETRHAALALAIHAWVWPRLSGESRAAIARAQAAAVRDLAHGLQVEPSREVRELAGVPDAATATTLHEAVRRELWTA